MGLTEFKAANVPNASAPRVVALIWESKPNPQNRNNDHANAQSSCKELAPNIDSLTNSAYHVIENATISNRRVVNFTLRACSTVT
jgi:hypothetical protein